MEKDNEKNEDKKELNEFAGLEEKNLNSGKKLAKFFHKKEKKVSDKEKIAELTEDLQRLQAEFENYRKRAEKETAEFSNYAKAGLIAKLLPLLDTFEIALRSAKIKDFQDAKNPKDFQANTKDYEKFIKGIEMIYSQFFSALEAEGLRPIPAQGKKFDPYYHEVMLKQKSDKEDGIVLEELQRGYMLKDKVLRYSKVKISENPSEDRKISEETKG